MSIDKSLKYFTRLDGQGRRISGSGVVRRKKPSIGKWVEDEVETCCFAFTALTDTPNSLNLSSVTVTLLCDATAISTMKVMLGSSTIDQLVDNLNTNLSYLGTFSTDGTTITLHLHQDIANTICPSGTVTMDITGSTTTTTTTTAAP